MAYSSGLLKTLGHPIGLIALLRGDWRSDVVRDSMRTVGDAQHELIAPLNERPAWFLDQPNNATAATRLLIEATKAVLQTNVLPPGRYVRELPILWGDLTGSTAIPLRNAHIPAGWSKTSEAPGRVDVRNEFKELVLRAVIDTDVGITRGFHVPPAQDWESLGDVLDHDPASLPLRNDEPPAGLVDEESVLHECLRSHVLARGVWAACLPDGTIPELEHLLGKAKDAAVPYSWVQGAGRALAHCEWFGRTLPDLLSETYETADAEWRDLQALDWGLARVRRSLDPSIGLESSVLPAVALRSGVVVLDATGTTGPGSYR